jgi:hypothetical protein
LEVQAMTDSGQSDIEDGDLRLVAVSEDAIARAIKRADAETDAALSCAYSLQAIAGTLVAILLELRRPADEGKAMKLR